MQGEETLTSGSNLFLLLEYNPFSFHKTEVGGDSNSILLVKK